MHLNMYLHNESPSCVSGGNEAEKQDGGGCHSMLVGHTPPLTMDKSRTCCPWGIGVLVGQTRFVIGVTTQKTGSKL